MLSLDSVIVAAYFLLIFALGFFISARQKSRAASDFISGGHTTRWWQTGLTLIAMAIDPAYMGMAGLGFLWGLYILQWNAVHIWFTSWFAAMFLVPIYWRSRITTTPEFLERRFNVQCRAFFSAVMTVILVVTLTSGLYLGALLLQGLLHWPLGFSVVFIATVCGFYVMVGGMRTVLVLDVYQGIFLLVTLGLVLWRAVDAVGGMGNVLAITARGDAGTPLPSLAPPSDWHLDTAVFFPAQAVVTWATVAGLSWLACNFGMAQRLLAARSERDAQKGLLFLGILAAGACLATYIIGIVMRTLRPELPADEAFMTVMLEMFPGGIRGVLVAGMMAALLSSADGMLTASSALLTKDIYVRFIRPRASGEELKRVARICQATALITSISLIPLLMKSKSAVTFVQTFYGDVLGVVVALYIVGVFSRRASGKAAFVSMLSGIVLAIALDIWTDLNFAYVGFFSFVYAMAATLVLSRFEPAPALDKLTNLTIYTLEDVKGPWVGLKAWPRLWIWALGLSVAWFSFSFVWEWAVRTSGQ